MRRSSETLSSKLFHPRKAKQCGSMSSVFTLIPSISKQIDSLLSNEDVADLERALRPYLEGTDLRNIPTEQEFYAMAMKLSQLIHPLQFARVNEARANSIICFVINGIAKECKWPSANVVFQRPCYKMCMCSAYSFYCALLRAGVMDGTIPSKPIEGITRAQPSRGVAVEARGAMASSQRHIATSAKGDVSSVQSQINKLFGDATPTYYPSKPRGSAQGRGQARAPTAQAARQRGVPVAAGMPSTSSASAQAPQNGRGIGAMQPRHAVIRQIPMVSDPNAASTSSQFESISPSGASMYPNITMASMRDSPEARLQMRDSPDMQSFAQTSTQTSASQPSAAPSNASRFESSASSSADPLGKAEAAMQSAARGALDDEIQLGSASGAASIVPLSMNVPPSALDEMFDGSWQGGQAAAPPQITEKSSKHKSKSKTKEHLGE